MAMAEDSDSQRPKKGGRGRPFPKGVSGNPGGMPPRTADQRAAETFLRERTLAAAERLVQLQSSDDEKIALGATTAHLRMVIGELARVSDAAGNPLVATLATMTRAEILEVVRSGK